MSYRLLYCFLVGAGICSVICLFWVTGYIIPAAPRAPDALHAIPFNNHGTVVYLTPFEDKAPFGLMEALVIVGLAGEWVRRRCNFNFRRDALN
jgi:hypothetical protein